MKERYAGEKNYRYFSCSPVCNKITIIFHFQRVGCHLQVTIKSSNYKINNVVLHLIQNRGCLPFFFKNWGCLSFIWACVALTKKIENVFHFLKNWSCLSFTKTFEPVLHLLKNKVLFPITNKLRSSSIYKKNWCHAPFRKQFCFQLRENSFKALVKNSN